MCRNLVGLLFCLLALPAFSAQNAKTVNGVAIANVKTINGVARANVKTILGVDNTGGGASPVFAWHMEDTDVTADSPAGSSAGDTTATLNGASISSLLSHDGDESLLCGATTATAEFSVSSDDIFNDDAGTVTIWIYVTTYVSGALIFEVFGDASNTMILRLQGSDADGSRHVRAVMTFAGAAPFSVTTTGTGMTLLTWHQLTLKWRTGAASNPGTYVQIDAQTAATSNTDTASWTTQATRIRYGNQGTSGAVFNLDQTETYTSYQ